MILYRFTLDKYSSDISGEGARLYGGRWNSKGLPVVYTSSTISLSLIELLVHSVNYQEIRSNVLVSIEVPDTNVSEMVTVNPRQGWQSNIDYCRFVGDKFLTSKESLLLKVPSAIIPEEFNILLNPRHSSFKNISRKQAEPFSFDSRLFKK